MIDEKRINDQDTRLDSQDKLLAELLLRLSTVEKLLLEKKLISLDEYSSIFNESVNKLIDVLKNDTATKISTETIPDGVLKN